MGQVIGSTLLNIRHCVVGREAIAWSRLGSFTLAASVLIFALFSLSLATSISAHATAPLSCEAGQTIQASGFNQVNCLNPTVAAEPTCPEDYPSLEGERCYNRGTDDFVSIVYVCPDNYNSDGQGSCNIGDGVGYCPAGYTLSDTGNACIENPPAAPEPPSIISVLPATGYVTGGTEVTITGLNLSGASVTIDGVGVNVPNLSDTSLTFTTPAHVAGLVAIEVSTPGGGPASSDFTFELPPQDGSTALAVSAASNSIVYGGTTTVTVSGGSGTGAYSVAGTQGICDVGSLGNNNQADVTTTGLGICTVTATKSVDATYESATATTDIEIRAPELTTKLAVPSISLTAGSAVTAFTPVTASGGFGKLAFVVSPALPQGLNLDPGTGAITGTPTAAAATASYTVTVSDHTTPDAQSSNKQFSLEVQQPVPPNIAPTANAGQSQSAQGPGIVVTLDGSASSDLNNDKLSYSWTQTGGPAVTLNSAATPKPTFISPLVQAPMQLVFQLIVNDGKLDSAPATVNVLVMPPAPPPPPEPQSQTINFTSSIAGATVGEGYYAAYATSSSGLPVSLSIDSSSTQICALDADGIKVTFTGVGTCTINANQPGNPSYLPAAQVQQSFTVKAAAAPAPTFASASPHSGSTLGGDNVTIAGANFSNPATVTIGGAAATNVTVVNSTTITVTTPAGSQGSASVLVATGAGTNDANIAFTYTLAPQTISFTSTKPNDAVVGGESYVVTAKGGASGKPVTFTIDGDSNGSCILGNDGKTVSFAQTGTCLIDADQAGNDSYAAATQVQQSFTVGPRPAQSRNTPPAAGAGDDRTVYSDTAVSFSDSSASDVDEDPLTYQWEQIDGPTVVLSAANSLHAAFTSPHLEPGGDNVVLTFKLTVSDGTESSSDTVAVTVQPRAVNGFGTLDYTISEPLVTVVFTLHPNEATSRETPTLFGVVSPMIEMWQLAGLVPPTPGGVTFYDGNTVLCGDVTLVNNTATCSVSLSPGPHNLRAVYDNGEVSVEPVSATALVSVIDQAGPDAKAIGGFLSDRANQIVTNLPGMDREIDRLNAAKQADGSGSSSNFAASGKGDLLEQGKGDLMLNTSRLGSGPSGASITASRLGIAAGAGIGPTRVGEQDMMGFQSFLYNYLRSAGEGGNFGHFNFSGPMDMQADFDSGGGHASFKASLSQMMEWQQQRDQKEMAALGFGQGGGPRYFMPFDIWTEGVYSSYSGTRGGAFGMATLGADYVFNPNFLAGFYGQFDDMNQTTGTAVDGTGWMIGPYATARLGDALFWQGRAGWGRSSNSISPDSSYTDQFATTRWLVSSSLSGKWKLGDGFAFAPTASFSYFEDKSDGYVDHYGTEIPGVKTSLGQVKLSPELSYGFTTDSDLWIEPSLATELIWNFASTNVDGLGSLDSDATGPAGLRGRVKAALTLRMPSGISIEASGTYDGIGSASYSAIAVQATLSIPLN